MTVEDVTGLSLPSQEHLQGELSTEEKKTAPEDKASKPQDSDTDPVGDHDDLSRTFDSFASRDSRAGSEALPLDLVELAGPTNKPELWIAKLSEEQASAWRNSSSTSGTVRKSSRMSAPPNDPRKLIRPPLTVDRSKLGPGVEIFQMLHNAIRQETIDLYDIILTAIERANYEITPEEVADMVAWWKVYLAFIGKYMTVEETLRSWVNLPLNTERLIAMTEVTARLESLKMEVRRNSDKVHRIVEAIDVSPTALVAVDFIECVDLFISSVCRFNTLLEKTLVPFFSEGQSDKDLRGMKQKVVKEFEKLDCQYGIVLLSAWIDTKDDLQQWIKEHIKGGVNERNRKYIRKQKTFFKEHRDILVRFCDLRKEATALQSIVSGHIYKFPSLRLRDTGYEWSGAMDLVSLLGNSVRNELTHLMKMLHIIVAHRFSNKEQEIDGFEAWYAGFEHFVTEVFSVESQGLFKYYSSLLENDGNRVLLRGGKSIEDILGRLNERRVQILGMLNDLREKIAEFKSNPLVPFEVSYEKFKLFERLFVLLVEYFNIQEKNFPGIVAAQSHEEASDQIKAQLCLTTDLIWRGANPSAHVIILSRWMPDAQRTKWYKFCVYGSPRTLQYRQWKAQFVEERGRFEARMSARLITLGRLAEAQTKRQKKSIRTENRRKVENKPVADITIEDPSSVYEPGGINLPSDEEWTDGKNEDLANEAGGRTGLA